MNTQFKKAAQAIKQAGALLITAGAGMGVDSGLPDFRGDQGFWKAYPMYERLGINFIDAANPANFKNDPHFGWGFYGHRMHLYRDIDPHPGFNILLEWIKRYQLDYFVATSNVDGHFQKAGFPEDRVYEVHGSIHYLQCMKPCSMDIWENKELVRVDHSSMRAEHLPLCPRCGGIARPNILMFGDFSWISEQTAVQEERFYAFLKQNKGKRMVVVELGAGTAVPTIRGLSGWAGSRYQAAVIRINPRESQITPPHIPLSCGALEGLRAVDKTMNE